MCNFTERLADLIRENSTDLASAVCDHGAESLEAIGVLREILIAAQTDERLELRQIATTRPPRVSYVHHAH